MCLNPNKIKERWARHAADAAHYGTWMHALFAAYLNGVGVPTSSPEFRMFADFMSSFASPVTAFRTKWVIYADREKLAGAIDFCAKMPDDTFIIVDWKHTAGLRGKFTSWNRMKAPLDHLDDCAGMQYRLQLNCYRYILETYYDLVNSRMFVVCCHPDHSAHPFVDVVPRMEWETEMMMA